MTNIELNRLRRELVSEKAELRKLALSEIKNFPSEQALPILVGALESKNNDVLADISKALLSYKDEALPYLIKALSGDSWHIRQGASFALGKLGANSLNKLMAMVPDNEEDVDYWMVQTLSHMGSEAVQYLVKVFKHPNQKIRIAAIRAAQNIKDPKMVTALLPLLGEQAWPVRKAAFDSLEEIYDCNEKAVADALDSCSDEARFWIIKLLAQNPTSDMTEKFAHIVETSPIESKVEAIKALAMIETPEAHRLLVSYLAHKSWIIRKTAADAIWVQGLGASDELISAAKDQNVDARYWSVKLLGHSQEPKIFDEIVKCLQDTQSSVRSASCQALGNLGDKRALAPLMSMLGDESEEVRTAAIIALGQIGDKDVELANTPSIPAHLAKSNSITCSHCGKTVGKDFTFCPFCLEQLKPATCRVCGKQLESGWKGCPYCGTKI